MAFTGEKVKGSRVLTPETVENRGRFYKLMDEIESNNAAEYKNIYNQMFWEMFQHLSHSSQKEILGWAERVEWNTCFSK